MSYKSNGDSSKTWQFLILMDSSGIASTTVNFLNNTTYHQIYSDLIILISHNLKC